MSAPIGQPTEATSLLLHEMDHKRKHLGSLPYKDQSKMWVGILDNLEKNIDQLDVTYVEGVLKEYLNAFPFDTKYWIFFGEYVTKYRDKEDGLAIFRESVELNSRDVDLWSYYSEWANKHFGKENATLIRNIFEQAIDNVGFDFHADRVWDEYILFEIGSPHKVNEIFQRVFKYPLAQLDNYLPRYKAFLADIPEGQVLEFYNSHHEGAELQDVQAARAALIAAAEAEYANSAAIVTKRAVFEDKLQIPLKPFETVPQTYLDAWTEYILHEKKANDFNQTTFLFEKALISLFYLPDLWLQYFAYLDEEVKNVEYLDKMVEKYQNLLINLSHDVLIYYILSKESKGEIDRCRSLFALHRSVRGFTIPMIINEFYFENRRKEESKIKTHIETSLEHVKENKSLLYIVQEFACYYFFTSPTPNPEAGISIISNAQTKLLSIPDYYFMSFDILAKAPIEPSRKLKLSHTLFNEFLTGNHSTPVDQQNQKEVWLAYIEIVRKFATDPHILKLTLGSFYSTFGRIMKGVSLSSGRSDPRGREGEDFNEAPRKHHKLM